MTSANIEGKMTMTTENFEVAALLDTIENLKSYIAKLETQVQTDQMTGLLNHATGELKLTGLCNAAGRRDADVFSIVLIDIDWFKKVNDTYGHAIGDEVIKSLAFIILNNIRTSSEVGLHDYAVRWGGEEMLLILQDTDLDAAYEVAERISHSFKALEFEPGFRKTISVGIATSARFESSIELFKRADEALYKSKSNGRNQITTALSTRY